MPHIIEEHVFQTPISGVNLTPHTLQAELGDQKTLLVFLRHLG